MLKQVARRLVNRLLLRRLPGPFEHDSGRCWVARLPHFAHLADNDFAPDRSNFVLYEDGIALRPAHAPREDIRAVGFGAYRHWEDHVYFSTSDNSDPNENGRDYRFSVSPWLYRRRVARFDGGGADLTRPVTYRKVHAHPRQIRQDVVYALSTGRHYLAQVRRLGVSLAGKTVLEVGPGLSCGCVLVLAAHGARPVVIDRFLPPWNAEYHPRFYTALADELARQDPDADVRPIRALVEAGGYSEAILPRYEAALEQVPIASGTIDVVLSHAVVEHLYDLRQSFAQLSRITRPGGIGLHQVDHRDHADFGRPLEYLLVPDDDFEVEFRRGHAERGNRYRPEEVGALFREAGFELLDFTGDREAEPDYLEGLLPRLRAATRSRYRAWPANGLRVVSGLFRVRKPG